MKNTFPVIILFTLISLWHCKETKQPIVYKSLLCEYAENPIAIATNKPRFSWIVEGSLSGQKQAGFRIRVASGLSLLENDQADLWDSGEINSDKTSHHAFDGKALESNRTYYWQVSVRDNYGNHATSAIASFSTAFLYQSDWKGKWIGAGPEKESFPEKGFIMHAREQYTLSDTVVHHGRSLLLRNNFQCSDAVKSARLFITGLGYYEAFINGRRIGDHVLSPAKTNYRHQILYNTYDVTELIKKGANAIGIHLGNGWFNPYKKWWQEYRMQWFGAKRAIAQLEINYTDGRSQTFISDESWKQADGPILFNCIYDGEIYDANQAPDGWSESNFDDRHWQPVTIMQAPGGEMVSQQMPAIKVVQTIKPINVTETKNGTRIYDMGQNFAGWIRLVLKGEKGTTVTMRFAEDIHQDGSLDVTSNEQAKATAVYTMKGGGTEVYEPKFTFFGFKYVEITANQALPEIKNIEGCVVYSSNPHTGSLQTGNELINKIHHATVWSQKSNMIGYPLDCPQRDERLGWFGDAQVTAEEALFNFEMALFYQNWLSGIRLNQHPQTGDIPIISPRPYIFDEGVEWSSTFFTLIWDYYRYYGDERILEENYQAMIQYMDFLKDISTDHIVPMGWIGDWGSLVEGWQEGEPASIPTAFYFYNATILSKIASVLDKTADQSRFQELSRTIRSVYNKKYFDPQTNHYSDGSQMANAFPIYLGLVEEEHKAAVLQNLVTDIVKNHNGHLTTGVLGSKYMIEALTMANRADVAWILVTATGYPSWSDMVEKYTTMCEFWTLKQSHNHVFTGSIDAWFYKALAGIGLDENKPAFKNIIIKPFIPDNLSHARASIETIAGTVISGWEKSDKGVFFEFVIPFNSTAVVHLPVQEQASVLINDKPVESVRGVKFAAYQNNYQVYDVTSGNYRFTIK